jgi:IS5 family transposase
MHRKQQGQWSFTDPWLSAEPAQELAAMSALLSADRTAAREVEQDLSAARQRHGRSWSAGGLSGEQVLRALVVKQLRGLSYRELAFQLADSQTCRAFCQLGWCDPGPSKSALAAGVKAIRAETLESINRRLLAAAEARGIESGRKVRVDTTVVESAIHWPSDSELLWDGVRVLNRLMERSRGVLDGRCPSFANRLKRAQRRRLGALNAKTPKERRRAYRDLLRVTAEVVTAAGQVQQALQRQADLDPRCAALYAEIERILALTYRVLDQTRRRVLEGKSVPAADKIVSLFEDHTDILRKDRRETLYGHKICLTSGASSLILDCVVLEGNPADASLADTMIERQIDLYGRAPRQAAFDGGFTSKDNLAALKHRGVEDVAFSKRRGLEIGAMVRSEWVYRRLRRFRAGIEGLISWLKRVFGLDRCTWRTLPSFRAYVWSSVLSCNLLVLARHLLA